ncbi:MAG: hypothetical protein NC337_06250 [Roseburia sp.]|nr:hypothetical protein [Roseburia sp.]
MKGTYSTAGKCFAAGMAFTAAAAALTGCGYRLNGGREPETVLYVDEIFGNTPTETQEALEPREEASEPQEAFAPQEEASQPQEEPSAEADAFWYEQYAAVLNDWTLIEDYGDFGYLPMYFGEDYAFDSYWLCDVDGNGIPELFLHSSSMAVITAVFTCTEEQLVFLVYDDFYGINQETGELVVHGHWHGAGGSYDNEWSAYQIAQDKAESSMYIDFIDFSEDGGGIRYTVYNSETGAYTESADGAEYEALYEAHVQPCVPVQNYTLYNSADLSGLDRIQ